MQWNEKKNKVKKMEDSKNRRRRETWRKTTKEGRKLEIQLLLLCCLHDCIAKKNHYSIKPIPLRLLGVQNKRSP
jgi:hypothetical protein